MKLAQGHMLERIGGQVSQHDIPPRSRKTSEKQTSPARRM